MAESETKLAQALDAMQAGLTVVEGRMAASEGKMSVRL